MTTVFEGNTLLQLADRLRGFFVGRDEVIATGGSIPVDHGTLTGLTDDDHAQYLLTNGGRTLTGNMACQASVTIDGVDISAHAADADAHHARSHAITSASDHTVTGTTYQIVGLTGTNTLGLLTPASTVGANQIPIGGTAGAITWSGSQTFTLLSTHNAGLTVNNTVGTFNAGVDIALGQALTTPTVDASASLTLAPTTNLILDPVNNITSMGSGVSIQASSYASQTTGWRATDAGEGDFRYLFVDEMHAKSFIADLEQALAGGQIIGKSVAMVAVAYTLPAAGAASTFTVRDLPSAPDMAVFEANDYVRFRVFSRAAGSLTIADAWGVVTGYTDNGDGTQTWTFTRSSGADAGTASGVIPVDAIVLDYGVANNGIHEVNAIDGAYGLNSPYAQVATWATHPRTMTTRTRLGNLRGIFSVANEYGLFAGSGTAVTDRYIRASSSTVSFVNVPLALYDGTNNTMLLTAGSSNNSPSLAMGATLPTGPLTGSGIWMGKDGADYEMRAGTITGGVLTTGIHWDGATLNIKGAVVVGPGIGFASAALLHLKFNGPPLPTDFQVDLSGHLGQKATAANVVSGYGLFGKAAQVSEATINLCPNPSAETNVTGFATGSTGGATITQSSAFRLFGSYSVEWVYGTGGSANLYRASDSPGMTAGQSYTFSCYLKRADGAAVTGITVYIDSSLGTLTPTITSVGDGWYRIAASRTFAGAPGNQVFGVTGLPTTVAVYSDGWQLENKAYATPYCDGSMGQGHTWSGTAHASTSARTAATLTYSTVQCRPSGTISAWLYTTASHAANGNYRYIAACNGVNGVVAGITNGDNLFLTFGGTSQCSYAVTDSNFAPDTWHHFAATWDQATDSSAIYLDGALVDTGGYDAPTDDAGGWDVGNSGGVAPWPGYIDDFVILERALTADDVSAIYGGGASTAKPFMSAGSPASLFLTGTGGGSVIGNASGLFGFDASSIEAFALSAGAVTWGTQYAGGSALAAGDLVLGDPDARHLFYDASAGTLAIKSNTTSLMSVDGSGNATFQGAVKATSGYIGGTTSGWTITTDTISASGGYLQLYNGNSTTTNITAGSGTDAGGVSSVASGSDVMFWAGQTHNDRGTAAFRVTAAGDVTAAGTISASAGYIGGTSSGWSISTNTISSTGISMVAGASPYLSFGASELLRLSPTGLTVLQAGLSSSYFRWLESMPSGAEVGGIYAYSDAETHEISIRTAYKAGSSSSSGQINTSIVAIGPSSVISGATVQFSDSSDDYNLSWGVGSNVPFRISSTDGAAANTNTVIKGAVMIETTHTPSSAGDTGSLGQFCWDGGHLYICIGTNTWRRVAHSTW